VRYGGAASFQDWRATLRNFGAVLDRSDEAEAYIVETEAELADLRADHGAVIDATTATEMKSTPDFVAINALSSALESGVLGTILLSELGFQAPPNQAAATVDEYGTIELSPENLGLVAGDLLFVEVREGTRSYESNPLWPTLTVVQDGGVVEVGNHWEYGGAVAARVVLDARS
jgi:ABC-type Fe3+-hydroxamate transport system substrate-binding protein